MEEQRRDWRSRDEIGGAGTRLEGLDVCKDKSSIVCSLLNWDLGRVMILEEQERNWRSRDKIGGAETRLEEQRRDWRSRDEIGGAETILEEQEQDWRGLLFVKTNLALFAFC